MQQSVRASSVVLEQESEYLMTSSGHRIDIVPLS